MFPRAADITIAPEITAMDCQGTRLMIINYCQRCSSAFEKSCAVKEGHVIHFQAYHCITMMIYQVKLEMHHGILTMNS